MTDFRTLLAELRRPRLLIRAARLGLGDYRRDRDLKRLISPAIFAEATDPEQTLARLISAEGLLEENRLRGAACYSVARHIEVMIALMAEARSLPADPQPAPG